jgi:hypothetical protein
VAFGFSGSLDHSLTSQSARSRQVPPSNRYFINHSKPASAWLAVSCAKPLPRYAAFQKDFLLRDLFNNINIKPAFPPVPAVTDNTAQVSTILDTFGYGSATLALITGTLTDADATFAVTLSESNDPAMAGSNAVAAGELLGTLALASFTFADDIKCKKLGYNGIRRYIQATVTPSANTGNLFVSGAWILGHPVSSPTSNPPQ